MSSSCGLYINTLLIRSLLYPLVRLTRPLWVIYINTRYTIRLYYTTWLDWHALCGWIFQCWYFSFKCDPESTFMWLLPKVTSSCMVCFNDYLYRENLYWNYDKNVAPYLLLSNTDLYMGVAICRAALHIGVVHSLICRAGMNQSKRLVLVTWPNEPRDHNKRRVF